MFNSTLTVYKKPQIGRKNTQFSTDDFNKKNLMT